MRVGDLKPSILFTAIIAADASRTGRTVIKEIKTAA
jgi:hypothetical protein